jgi:hypothetical protein
MHPNVLMWCTVIHTIRRTLAQHIHSSTHHLAVEPSGKALALEDAPSGYHHHAILMFDNVVLPWAVGHRVLMMHALSCTLLNELPRGNLASAVGAECPQLQARLPTCSFLDLLDSSHYMILGGDHDYPHVPTEVIHEQ